MTAAERYAAAVDAYQAQQAELARHQGDRWANCAAYFRLDPRRELDANLRAVAELVQPGDVVVDIGGGAGRVCLPLALQCQEVVNVEPSKAMREEFSASAAGAGITNAVAVDATWPSTDHSLAGDVVITANVTYFVRDIVAFVRAMAGAARRRVMIQVWSVPPPNFHAALFARLHGVEQALAPGHELLLPVLWEMGILPDVRVLPMPFRRARQRPPTRDDAIAFALESATAEHLPGARERVVEAFDDLFAAGEDGFVPRWVPDPRELLITWETGNRR